MLVSASLWSVVTLGLASKTVSERGGADGDGTLLANQSVLVLLVLTNHCTTDRGYGLNLCRDALLLFSDDGGTEPACIPLYLEHHSVFSCLFSLYIDIACLLFLETVRVMPHSTSSPFTPSGGFFTCWVN